MRLLELAFQTGHGLGTLRLACMSQIHHSRALTTDTGHDWDVAL